jgi:hypothetical protein
VSIPNLVIESHMYYSSAMKNNGAHFVAVSPSSKSFSLDFIRVLYTKPRHIEKKYGSLRNGTPHNLSHDLDAGLSFTFEP